MKSSQKKIALMHLLCCSLFLLMPVLVSTRPPEEPWLTVTKPFIRDIGGNALLLAFFYLNYYWLIPKLYYQRKYVLYAGLVLLSLVLVIMLPSIFTGRLFARPHSVAPSASGIINPMPVYRTLLMFLFDEMKHHLYLFIIALFFSLMLRIRERMTRIKEEKLQVELNSLKAQINPHFLFNTLNSIYALAIKNDEKTADAVINLSELMRYIIKDAHNNKVLLEKELNYISNYIDLQRSRFGNTARIYFTADGDAKEKEIAPLLLITFIENAFKYGINPDADSEIRIQIDIKKTDLHLQVYNKKVKIGNAINSTCIGIKNTKERLQLLYPSKHAITITDNNSYFLVDLIITLS